MLDFENIFYGILPISYSYISKNNMGMRSY
jgi:hypothetical protein